MKLLTIGKYDYRGSGGIETVSRDWLRLFSEYYAKTREVEITFLGFANESYKTSGLANVRHSLYRSQATFFSQPISLSLFATIIAKAARADVIHVHLPNLLSVGALLVTPRKTGQTIIVHWHADILNKNGALSLIANALQRRLLARTDIIFCTSPNYAAHSEQLAFFKEKILVAPITRPTPVHGLADRPSFDIDRRGFILSVGRLVRYKNFEGLINAYKSANIPQRLVIAGDGPLRNSLTQLVQDLALSDSVLILHDLSNEALDAHYRNCDYFVLASNSRSEAYGVVIVEAMSFGKAVICADIEGSGMTWLNQDSVTGLHFKNNDADSLAQTLRKLSFDESLREHFGKNALGSFSKTFSDGSVSIANIKPLVRKIAAP